MEGPGISLFQGSDSIKLGSNINAEEDEEFLEDEKKRKEELKNLFKNAFDDLEDDCDGSTIDSSRASSSRSHSDMVYKSLDGYDNKHIYNDDMHTKNHIFPSQGFHQTLVPTYNAKNLPPFTKDSDSDISNHYQHCYRTSPGTQPQLEVDKVEAYRYTDNYGMDQLKTLYDVRLREIEKLNNDLDAERESKKQLLNKLSLIEAEKENAVTACSQRQEMLDASSRKLSDLENVIVQLKKDVLTLEQGKYESDKELGIARMQISNMKQTMETMERCDASINREKQMDSLLNSIQAKYQREILFLQQQYDSATLKVNQKDIEYNALEKKLEDLERKHSALLLNKCDSVVRQESTLQALLEEANNEKLNLLKELNKVQNERDVFKSELDQYDRVSKFRLLNSSSSDEHETDSMLHLGLNRQRNDSKRSNILQGDVTSKLKDELFRALMGR